MPFRLRSLADAHVPHLSRSAARSATSSAIRLILPRRDAGARSLAVDALEQTGEDAAGPDFVECVEAVGEHPAHRIFPADALEDLGDQGAADVVRVVVGRGVDVRVDGNARRVDRCLGQDPASWSSAGFISSE